jgi:hypothetical protein
MHNTSHIIYSNLEYTCFSNMCIFIVVILNTSPSLTRNKFFNIFQYISNKMQCYTVYLYLETVYCCILLDIYWNILTIIHGPMNVKFKSFPKSPHVHSEVSFHSTMSLKDGLTAKELKVVMRSIFYFNYTCSLLGYDAI